MKNFNKFNQASLLINNVIGEFQKRIDNQFKISSVPQIYF